MSGKIRRGTERLFAVAGLTGRSAKAVQSKLSGATEFSKPKIVATAFPAGGSPYARHTVDQLLRASGNFALRRRGQRDEEYVAPSEFFLLYVPSHDQETLLAQFDFFAFPVALGEERPMGYAETDALCGWRADPEQAVERVAECIRGLVTRGSETEPRAEWTLVVREIQGNTNGTALLLPPHNFETPNGPIRTSLLALARRDETWDSLGLERRKFVRGDVHGVSKTKRFFQDERKLVFPPALPTERHGDVHPIASHESVVLLQVLLNQLFRFGVAIAEGFHFDVQRVRAQLSRQRFHCARRMKTVEVTGTHANIFPNDVVLDP